MYSFCGYVDGVRRSTRKRKKNTVLSEYETGVVDGMDETDIADDGATDPEAHPEVAIIGDNLNRKGIRGKPGKPPGTPVATSPSVAANLSAPMQQMLMKMGLLPSKSTLNYCFNETPRNSLFTY